MQRDRRGRPATVRVANGQAVPVLVEHHATEALPITVVDERNHVASRHDAVHVIVVLGLQHEAAAVAGARRRNVVRHRTIAAARAKAIDPVERRAPSAVRAHEIGIALPHIALQIAQCVTRAPTGAARTA